MNLRLPSVKKIKAFSLEPGTIVSDKYTVINLLGQGWEGEVYLIRELSTGIERTAKFFYPSRNIKDKNLRSYARKLHKLRSCPIVIHYHTQDIVNVHGHTISFLISEYVEGELLSAFLARQPGSRLGPFAATHLLYALAQGMLCVHGLGEYHGDLHTDNIIVQRFGMSFELKLLDMFYRGATRKEYMQDDLIELIQVYREALGGAKYYSRQPDAVKYICCGLRRSLILKKFRSVRHLCRHLETMHW
jgi:serine/threonine protein kinase